MRRVAGSLSVEAAVVTPVILGVCLFFVMLMRMVLVDALVGYALHESARTLAQGHYLLSATGFRNAGDEVRDAAAPPAGAFEEKAEILAAGMSALSSGDTQRSEAQAAGEVIREGVEHPVQSLREMSAALLLAGAEQAMTTLTVPLLKQQMRQHLAVPEPVLKALGVSEGIDGLDFSGSRILMEGDTLDIRVGWTFRSQIPLPLPADWPMGRRVRITALGKGGMPQNGNADAESIWDMDPKARGKKIQEALGRNLPDYFTTLCRFSDGEAVAVHSLDLTLPSYQTRAGLRQAVSVRIRELAAFVSCEAEGISIQPEDIRHRRLILVIPEEAMTDIQTQCTAELTKDAAAAGIVLEVRPWKENEDVRTMGK